ncbi:MAG: 3-methyl-2-oxobutanoate hydroxymethyltransferase, partial [Candidatus Margulisiibacteriota bacterium]
MKKIMPENIINKRAQNEKIIMLTAYDYTFARLLDENEIDIILVGDS